MPTVADIVHEELAFAEARIAERIVALVGGGVGKIAPTGRAAAPLKAPRFVGRVKERLRPEDVTAASRRVLEAIRKGASTSGQVQKATGLSRHRVTYVTDRLIEEGRIRRRGTRRTAKYSPRG